MERLGKVWPSPLKNIDNLYLYAMKRKAVRKKGRKTAGKRGRVSERIAKLKLPKPIEKRVLEETDNPEEVQVVTRRNGPLVVVKGKTVGAWLDL